MAGVVVRADILEDKDGKIKKKRRKSNDKEQSLFAHPKKKKSQIEMEKAYQNIIKDNELLMGCQ